MARIKITKAAEQNSVRVSNTSVSADVPIDGAFHDIHDDLLPVLDNSAVEYEIEADDKPARAPRKRAKQAPKPSRAPRKRKAGGGAAGLGDSAAPLTRPAAAKAEPSAT